jgi:hypothetical protein
MGLIIDCSNYDNALKSISEIFSVPSEKIVEYFYSIRGYYLEGFEKSKIFKEFCGFFGNPISCFEAIWFHGTRASGVKSFYEKGLLPRNKIDDQLRKELRQLSAELEKRGSYCNNLSVAFKQGEADDGPFAFLIKDAVVNPLSDANNYVKAPEFVADYSGEILGENYRELVKRYQANTASYIVAFKGKCRIEHLEHAIWYAYLTCIGVNTSDDGALDRCCFDGKGEPVTPDKIVSIEKLQIAV